MKVGDKLDPIAVGHRDIDVKTMLKESGYVTNQMSMAKLPELPDAVKTQVNALKKTQEAYLLGAKTKVFTCPGCGSRCSAQERIEVASGDHFFACGTCDTVVEIL